MYADRIWESKEVTTTITTKYITIKKKTRRRNNNQLNSNKSQELKIKREKKSNPTIYAHIQYINNNY